MNEPQRQKVHVCDLCQAIWQGTHPPTQCPGCSHQTTWQQAEVGPQKGMVGGRVFVPGTQTPMTRIFYCDSCNRMAVTRRGAPPPQQCSQCGATQEHLREAAAAPTPEPLQTVSVHPPAVLPSRVMHEAPPLSKEAKQEIRRIHAAQLPQPSSVPTEAPPSLASSGRPEDVEWSIHAEAKDADSYRSEWISDRVAANFDANPRHTTSSDRKNIWDDAEALYDEGRERGHLP